MHELKFTLEVVTPMFAGGAEQDATLEDGLRPPELRGAMRFWFRAARGNLSPAALANEEEVFGAPGRHDSKGSVLGGQGVRLLPAGAWLDAEIAQPVNRVSLNDPLCYLGYGPIVKEKGRETVRTAIKAGSRYTFRLVARSEEALIEAAKALGHLAIFGGIGARSRRGFGSVRIVEATSSSPDAATACRPLSPPPADPGALRKTLGPVLRGLAAHAVSRPEHTAFGPDSRLFVWNQAFESPDAALRELGKGYKAERREGAKRFSQPERSAFGVPFKNVAIRTKSVTLQRRASPLLFSIQTLETRDRERFVPVILFLPSRFAPEGAEGGPTSFAAVEAFLNSEALRALATEVER